MTVCGASKHRFFKPIVSSSQFIVNLLYLVYKLQHIQNIRQNQPYLTYFIFSPYFFTSHIQHNKSIINLFQNTTHSNFLFSIPANLKSSNAFLSAEIAKTSVSVYSRFYSLLICSYVNKTFFSIR